MAAAERSLTRASTRWHMLSRRVRRWGGSAGALITLAYVVAGLVSSLPVVGDPFQVNTLDQFTPPGLTHLFGTDQFGRDQLARIMLAIRLSLVIVVPASAIALVVGSALGLAAGYLGSLWDNLIMRAVDVLFAFPPVLLALVIIAALGPGTGQLVAAISIVYAPAFVRIVRGQTLELREREFVQAAIVAGATRRWIIAKHLAPGALPVAVVQLTLTMSWALLTETALSYLGLGLEPPTPDLGAMLSDGAHYISLAPWLGVFPGLVIMVAVLGFNLLGDALRDALDPRRGGGAGGA